MMPEQEDGATRAGGPKWGELMHILAEKCA